MRKGCETFLVVILDSNRGQVDVEKILVLREFPYVFSEELLDILLEREVDLAIEIIPGTVPMSRAPYRMAPRHPYPGGPVHNPSTCENLWISGVPISHSFVSIY